MLLTKQQSRVIIKATNDERGEGMIHKPYFAFKGWLRGQNLTYRDIAQLLGLSIATVSAKINGTSDFSLSEINVLKKKYGLDSAIFFTDTVA